MPSKSGPKKNDNGISNFIDVKGLSRDRPWLLASNRKLRHLQGISLRNLSLSRPTNRPRGKTIDDESLPNAFRTPTKLLIQQENHKLEHSRSSNDLKSPRKRNGLSIKEDSDTDIPTKLRPSANKLRRRSTLNWTSALPRTRQEKLEEAAGGRMADTWFSLHCPNIPEPVYISEIIEKAMNPDFRFFDLNTYGPSVTRRDELIIKYWAKTENMGEFILLIELRLHLRCLQFIGKTLESFHHPFPENCIIFHLSDGIYTSFTNLPLDETVYDSPKRFKQPQEAQPTSSFDALMRLSNLDDCIQDALSTRETLTAQINKTLEENRQVLQTINSVSQSQESLASTQRSLSTARKLLKSAETRRSDLQASLKLRRSAMISGTLSQDKAQSHLTSAQSNFSAQHSLLESTKLAISGQIRRICEDLMRIYPIEPVAHKQLLFTVGGLTLPNANSHSSPCSEADPAETAAALSSVAHIVRLLSFYLSTPIPYPPTVYGSTSSIVDPVSTSLHSLPARTFPLYQKGAVTFRFEYGVFLLNSDIELLMSRQGLRMVDQRQTLPNLKYLLYVLTAGKGELPVRMKGDVRGLAIGGIIGQRKDSDTLSLDNGNGPVMKSKYRKLEVQNSDRRMDV